MVVDKPVNLWLKKLAGPVVSKPVNGGSDWRLYDYTIDHC